MIPVPKPIQSLHTAKPIGAYSQAIVYDRLLFISGQIALREDGTIEGSDIRGQVRYIFGNLREILRAAGSSTEHILDVTVFLTDMGDFRQLDEQYGRELGDHRPTRAVIEVSALPRGAKVELKVLACVPSAPDQNESRGSPNIRP